MTAIDPASALIHVNSSFINFQAFDFVEGGHGCRWVDFKRFRLGSGTLADRDVLAALIAHPQFRDTYDGAGVQKWPRHGQWWLDRISPGSYMEVDDATAVATIRSWAGQFGDVPERLEARLRQEVYIPIGAANGRYLLRQLPREACHDYGPIHIDYHELVLIDRSAGALTLLVAADD